MAKLIQSLVASRGAGFLLVGLLVLVVYLVGYLSGADPMHLHLAAAVVVAVSLVVIVIRQQRAAKAASGLEAALRAQGDSQAGGMRPDQRAGIEELKTQFDESLDALRKSKLGRGALYSIPWYMLIGPPGSGKSTLLRQSGLSFPYMTKNRSAIRGLGGTKNCDWWFADRGILLDTAGRYTTEAEDREEWMAFLRMLKKGRGQRPINGAIVAIALSDLVEASDSELQQYAENVRDRVDELTRELQAVFPIYVVFTKCDRLRGFVETFDTLNKDQRRQVWGFTFPFQRGKEFVVADEFGKEFDELYRALTVRRIDLLASDHFKKRKAQVYAFPLQFLSVKERLQGFLAQIQQPNPYQEVSPIRGVYFTSGTQEGTTIDRILKVLRPAELELDVPEESRRCYFVDDLFGKVVFEDAALAAPTQQARRRETLLRRVGAAVFGVAALTTIVLDWRSTAAFAADCREVEGSVVVAGAEPGKVLTALDAQLRLLKEGNHHLERGSVLGSLREHYGKVLQGLATERIGAYISERSKALRDGLPGQEGTPAARLARFAAVDAALRELTSMRAGVEELQGRKGVAKPAAADLWRRAIVGAPDPQQHFEYLYESGLPFTLVLDASVIDLTRDGMVKEADDGLKRDLAEAEQLPPEALFPRCAEMLAQGVSAFGDLGVPQTVWSGAARGASGKGPLFSTLSVGSKGLHLEGFFTELAGEFTAAVDRQGASSQRPLKDVPGNSWPQFVERSRDRFLRTLEGAFDDGWRQLLAQLGSCARSGGEVPSAAEDLEGSRRLDVLPDLVHAHRVARGVLAQRGPIPDAAKATIEEQHKATKGKHQPLAAEWSRKPGQVADLVDLGQIKSRAEIVNGDVDREGARIRQMQRDAGPLAGAFVDLEAALFDAVCSRQWSALRKKISGHAAEKVLPAWGKMIASYPFAPAAAEEASAPRLQAALAAMTELDQALQALKPERAFALSAEFRTCVEQSRALVAALYGDLGVQLVVAISNSGAKINFWQLNLGEARLRSPDSVRLPWKELGISLLVDTTGRQPTTKDVLLSRVPGETQGKDGDLKPALWSLKRLFAVGDVKAGAPGEWISRLSVQGLGAEDSLEISVTTDRPASALLFDPAFPSAGLKFSGPLWNEP